jgi:hypothetical protein
LERGTCHTLWHRLDLDFVFDESFTGWLSAYTCGSTASTACTSGSAVRTCTAADSGRRRIRSSMVLQVGSIREHLLQA